MDRYKTIFKEKKLKEGSLPPLVYPKDSTEEEDIQIIKQYIRKNKGKKIKINKWQYFIVGEEVSVRGDSSVGIPDYGGVFVHYDPKVSKDYLVIFDEDENIIDEVSIRFTTNERDWEAQMQADMY